MNNSHAAATSLQHDDYIVFMPGPVMEQYVLRCTPLSIAVDLVYSVNRTFVMSFTLMNERDPFTGDNMINVRIIENGNV